MRRRLIPLILAMLLVWCIPVRAETAETGLSRSPLLDVSLTMLEKGNIFTERYNALTGAQVEARFEYGMPYFFGGRHDFFINGKQHVFAHEPLYSINVVKEQTRFYARGRYYLYGFDCTGFTQWVFSEVGWPRHPALDQMILNYSKYGTRNHLYSHRKGKEMPPFDELAETLQVGDLLVGKKRARHVLMYIGTLRQFGFTAAEVPELAEYLDYPLVIHCGANLMYGERIQRFLDEHAGDPYYEDVLVSDGGVAVSIIGVPFQDAPNHGREGIADYAWFELPGGYKLTVWDLSACTSFCWFRPNGI